MSMKILTEKINLDLNQNGIQATIDLREGDIESRLIIATLRGHGDAFRPDDDAIAVIRAKKPDGTIIFNNCVVEDGKVKFLITSQYAAVEGNYNACIEIVKNGEVLYTPKFAIHVSNNELSDSEVESSSEYTELTTALEQALTALELAQNLHLLKFVENLEDEGDEKYLYVLTSDYHYIPYVWDAENERYMQLESNLEELADFAYILNLQKERIDNLLAETVPGSTTRDLEVIDGRQGYDGITYANLGTAIREQVYNLHEEGISLEGRMIAADDNLDNIKANKSDVNTTTANIEAEIAVERARIDQIANTPGSTTGDLELADIRVGADGETYNNAGDAVRGQISDTKNDLIDVTNKVVMTEKEYWYNGTLLEAYKTSTFSGFATSWVTSEDKFVKSISFKVKSRATSNITEIRYRIESGSFATEKSITVNIGSEMTDVTIPINKVVPSGTVWIGLCANQIATFEHISDSTTYAYKYWTNGNLSDLASLKTSGGSVRKLYIEVDCYKNINATQIEKRIGNNLLDPTTIINTYWFEGNNNLFKRSTNQYTGNYSCVVIPVEGLTKITVFSTGNPDTKLYRYFASADVPQEDNVYIPYMYASTAEFISLQTPQTISVPTGAKYICMTVNMLSGSKIMANSGSTALPYEDYSEKYLLDGNIIAFESEDNYIPEIKVPNKYDLIVGDTFELFYKGIINSYNDKYFFIDALCSKGSNFTNKYVITPSTAENLTLSLSLYDPYLKLNDKEDTILSIHSVPTSPISQKNILCVGDSLTISGTWVAEMKRRLTGSGGSPAGYNLSNIAFIGTCKKQGVKFEGYGGWSFVSYNTANVSPEFKDITCTHDKTEADDQHSIYTDGVGGNWKLETIENGKIKIILVSGSATNFPATGTLTWVSGGTHHSDIVYTASENTAGNPFWDSSENKVDFLKYGESLGVNSIDYVYVLLGWNSASLTMTEIKTQAQTFIDNVQTSYPNAKIVLMGLQIPARDGLGVNYGATGTYSKYINLVKYVHNLDDMYDELVNENINVLHINIAGQFDTEHNMLKSTRPVNVRNAETETYQTNGVHPADSGYLQIADACVRHIAGIL